MAWGNSDYWKARRGDLYAEQQDGRRRFSQQAYEHQEVWLLAQLDARAAAGLTSRVLDFGVGFGRMARLLAGRGDVDYFGFDISEEMVAPLLRQPPEALGDIEHRILIADRLGEIANEQQFDVIFSISVLIHNTPEQASAVLADMKASLAPGGEIWLVENTPVLFSMLDNVWHDGCWVHDFAFSAALGCDVEIDIDSVPGHGVYRLRLPFSEGGRQVTWRERDGAVTAITRDAYCQRAIARTEQAVRGLESEVAGIGPGVGAFRDDAELYRRANALSADVLARFAGELPECSDEKRTPLSHLISEFDHIARRLVAAEQATRALSARLESAERERSRSKDALRRRQHLLQAIITPGLEQMESRAPIAPQSSGVQDTAPQLDSIRDTRLAQPQPGFERVCHVVHQEWFGIRAAAGALPGRKLTISAARPPTASEIDHVATWLGRQGVDRVVVHGFSEPMAALIRGLRVEGLSHISLVWHGAPIMWMHEPERRLFFLALSLARKGYLRRIHGMRAGTEAVLGQWGWARQLLNMPPHVMPRPRAAPVRERAIALAPSWNLLHKNLTTNVLGAIEADCVDQVWVLANDFALPPDLHRKVKVLPELEPQQMLDTMYLADVVLNASIVDCHPMVELESLAVGTPAIRGRLWLDALEDHPYVRLTEVQDALDIRAVAERISVVHSLARTELEPMMEDYSRRLVAVSAERYAEFLEL
jgi:SAM-dependent methyltransferase